MLRWWKSSWGIRSLPDFQKIDADGSYTLAEAAALKGVSYQRVLYAVHKETLRATRIDNRFVVSGADLLTWKPGRRSHRKPLWPGREF